LENKGIYLSRRKIKEIMNKHNLISKYWMGYTLFKYVLKNIELQKKYEIKVINDDNDLSSQLDSDTCLVSESGISEWSDSFGESINIDMNINFHSPKQTVVA
ncbi:MAG: hypothetical protein H9Q65_00280, partial [Spiroplasma ixodetis]|nr:hypothetical protein [Spiroplasma ixodetis]